MIPSFLDDNSEGTPALYFSPCGTRVKKTALSFSQLCPQYLAHAWHVLSVWQFLSDGSIGSMLSALLLWDSYGYSSNLWESSRIQKAACGHAELLLYWAKYLVPPRRRPQPWPHCHHQVQWNLQIVHGEDVGTKSTAVGQPQKYTDQCFSYMIALHLNHMWGFQNSQETGKRWGRGQPTAHSEFHSAVKV